MAHNAVSVPKQFLNAPARTFSILRLRNISLVDAAFLGTCDLSFLSFNTHHAIPKALVDNGINQHTMLVDTVATSL